MSDPRQQPPVTPPQFGQYEQYGQQSQPYRQPQYQQQPQPQFQPRHQPPRPPRRRKPNKALRVFAWGSVSFLLLVVMIIVLSSKSSSPTAAPTQAQPAAPAQPAAKAKAEAPAAQTVTYVVTGSTANVTYGPAGTDLSGSVPMHVAKPLGTPSYYAITAQLQGGGTVSCKIEVDGKTISSSTAQGGYNIAQCEISQDPLSGQWQDTNA